MPVFTHVMHKSRWEPPPALRITLSVTRSADSDSKLDVRSRANTALGSEVHVLESVGGWPRHTQTVSQEGNRTCLRGTLSLNG